METAILAQDPALDLPRNRPARPFTPREGRHRPATTGAAPTRAWLPTRPRTGTLPRPPAASCRRLVGALVDAHVLVVSGPSGAGKSSLVRAGLVPALAEGALPGSADWQPVIITPGPSPSTRSPA